MVFADLIFLYVFLPVNLLIYYSSKDLAWRNGVLVFFSFVFYAWGEPVWIILLLTSASWDYMCGRVIEAYRGAWPARLALISSLCVNFFFLGAFKYSEFFTENVHRLLGISLPSLGYALPIGISFYTFQTISYVVDVYRGDTSAQETPGYYLLYLSLYHQLVAGPVVRYTHVAAEIRSRQTSLAEFSEGLSRFLMGLAKKVLIANTAGELALPFLDGALDTLSTGGAWFGAGMFMLQIYFDFSGYSDMAIGLGRMFGFHYRENFNYPYAASSAVDFWRRWHISLSSFFRDYVYIPLGGSRRRQARNLLIVWFLTGLWHGASWNFVLWGLYWGSFILLEHIVLGKVLDRLPIWVGRVYLLLVALFGWVLFYFTDMSRFWHYVQIMLGMGEGPLWDYRVHLVIMNNLFWILAGIVLCTPLYAGIRRWIGERFGSMNLSAALYLRVPVNLLLMVLCTASLVGQSYNPFLYYRF